MVQIGFIALKTVKIKLYIVVAGSLSVLGLEICPDVFNL